MAVIINEFEVLVETPAQQTPQPQPPPVETPPAALNPQDIQELDRFLAERRERVRAD